MLIELEGMDFRTVSRRNFIAGGLALAAVNVVGTGRAAAAPSWAGSGTAEDPYVVTTVDELQNMKYAEDPEPHFVLGNDIDATETATWNSGAGFDPIGDYSTPFNGTLDGRSHTIDGLTIARSKMDDVGLFGRVTGTVRNLSLTNVDVEGDTEIPYSYIGSLVGYLGNTGLVESVSAAGTVTGYDQVGGLVGRTNHATIQDSSANVAVTGEWYVGGLTGANTTCTIEKSWATGDVSGRYNIGGISGHFDEATIDWVYATGAVTGEQDVGGFAGVIYSGTKITQAYAAGAVSADGATDVGGFAGSVSSVSATAAYWNTTTSKLTAATGNSPSYPGIVGLTTAQMTGSAARSNLTGFDFAESWYTTDSYPRLVWGQPPSDGPADFTVEDDEGESTVRFSTHTPTVGEEVTITVDISNVGGKSGRFIGNLNDGFRSLGRANPRLQSGESATLTYTVTFEKRGMHRLFLGSDHIGDVHVQRA